MNNAMSLPIVLSRVDLDLDWIHTLSSQYQIAPWSTANSNVFAQTEAVITNGTIGLNADELNKLPALKLVLCFGAGFEGVNIEQCTQQGVKVAHAPNVNSQSVADHAMALMLALVRAIPALDRKIKLGEWHSLRTPPFSVRGKTLGIVGLGLIGKRLAQMAQSAFGMEIAYLVHTYRHEHYHSCDDLVELARMSDILVLTCPGGPTTRHIINAQVLEALGPRGYIINVARGSVIDTQALIDALTHKKIAGAALDVLETEPQVPSELTALDSVILTPHIAGRSPETRIAQLQAVQDNLNSWFTHNQVEHALN